MSFLFSKKMWLGQKEKISISFTFLKKGNVGGIRLRKGYFFESPVLWKVISQEFQ